MARIAAPPAVIKSHSAGLIFTRASRLSKRASRTIVHGCVVERRSVIAISQRMLFVFLKKPTRVEQLFETRQNKLAAAIHPPAAAKPRAGLIAAKRNNSG